MTFRHEIVSHPSVSVSLDPATVSDIRVFVDAGLSESTVTSLARAQILLRERDVPWSRLRLAELVWRRDRGGPWAVDTAAELDRAAERLSAEIDRRCPNAVTVMGIAKPAILEAADASGRTTQEIKALLIHVGAHYGADGVAETLRRVVPLARRQPAGTRRSVFADSSTIANQCMICGLRWISLTAAPGHHEDNCKRAEFASTGIAHHCVPCSTLWVSGYTTHECPTCGVPQTSDFSHAPDGACHVIAKRLDEAFEPAKAPPEPSAYATIVSHPAAKGAFQEAADAGRISKGTFKDFIPRPGPAVLPVEATIAPERRMGFWAGGDGVAEIDRNDGDPALVFDVRGMAQVLFRTDPRVQQIVNRVTNSATPRFSPPARRARCWNVPAADLRARRQRAFAIAWGRERALRHDAIRRAVFMARGMSRDGA